MLSGYKMKTIKLSTPLLFLAFFISSYLSAQNGISNNAGARGQAMSNASVNFRDVNSLFSNQAGLAHIETPTFLAFSEQRFALNEIRSIAAGLAYPFDSGVFGLSVQYFGFENYNEQKVGVNYARKLAEKVSLGAQVNYLNFRIPEYGNSGFVSFEIGLQAEIYKDVFLGAHLANPIGQEVVADEELPTVFRVGLSYSPGKKVNLNIETEKDLDFALRIKTGIEYLPIEALALRIGFANNPSSISFGIGYSIKDKLRIDVGTQYHQVLGFSPGIGIVYQLKK